MSDSDSSGVAFLAYIGFESPAYDAWESFGSEVLGLELVESTEEVVLLRNDDVKHNIAIHRGFTDRLAYLGWAVPDERYWDRLFAMLSKAGISPCEQQPSEAEARGALRLATFTDPAGFSHEIIFGQYREPGTFRPARPISGFVAQDRGVGHIGLCIPADLYDDSFDFYTEAMGFRHSDRVLNSELTMDFFHLNSRHHTLAILRTDDLIGIQHLMLEVRELDDVGTTHDLCRAHHIPITRALGVHTTDRMFSFYLRSPSGFDIEYGTGGLDVDRSSPWTVGNYQVANIWGHQTNADIGFGACIQSVRN